MSGCRSGSIRTPWYTFENKLVVMSLISLWQINDEWRMKVKPPRGQVKACCTLIYAPLIHLSGFCSGFQPYPIWIASQNAVLLRWNLCSSIGKVDSQLDAPFSDVSSIILGSPAGASSSTSATALAVCVDFCWKMLVLACFCSASQLGVILPSCCRASSDNGLDMEHESVYSRVTST